MNFFNRVVVTLLLLALILIVTVGLIVPQEAIQLLRDGLDQVEQQLDLTMSARRLLISGVLALFIDGLLVFLLYLQVRRPRVRTVPVKLAKGGQAQVAVSSVVSRLKYHIDPLSGVLNVKPKVTAHRRGVEVALDVEMAADANMPTKIEEISTVARQVIEDDLGLRLKGKPQLHLRTVTGPKPMVSKAGTAPEVETEVGEAGLADLYMPVINGEIGAEYGDESGSAIAAN
jgi:hypothetical protein